MVFSLLSYKIEYYETPDVNKVDINHESSIYQINLFGKETDISLGKVDKSYLKDNVLFVRIYLLSSQKIIDTEKKDENDVYSIFGQIGVYEIEFYNKCHKDVDEIINKQGEVYLEKLGEPLLFTSCQQMIETGKKIYPIIEPPFKENNNNNNNNNNEKEIQRKKENEMQCILDQIDLDIEDLDDVVVKNKENIQMEIKISPQLQSLVDKKIHQILLKGYFLPRLPNFHNKLLPDETKEMAEQNVQEYNKEHISNKGSHNWINKYTKNINYMICSVPSRGDCFFLVIVEALKQIGLITTVPILRAIIAKNTSVKEFTQHRKNVLEILLSIEKSTTELKRIKSIITDDIKKQLKSTLLSQKKRKQLTDECFELLDSYKKIDKENTVTIQFKKEMFGDFFEKIDSIENYKEFILTSDFWVDNNAIFILEKELNVKIIILSSDNITDPNEIIYCNNIPEEIQNKMDRFQPTHYIMTTCSGKHYQSVSYKNRKILEYSEIPYQIKLMIVQKCMSCQSVLYNSIQDFIEFKTQLGIDDTKTKTKTKTKTTERKIELDLYDSSCVFLFYSKSADMKPGISSGDTIEKEKMLDFIELSGKCDWRRKMDDSYVNIDDPFSIDGLSYASVMHYYQGSKFKNGHPEFSKQFSLDSKSRISLDIKECIFAATSKHGKITNKDGTIEILRPIDVIIDTNFYPFRNIIEREKAIHAKFVNSDELKSILLSTKRSQLNHYIGNKSPEIAISLMKVRDIL